MALMQLTLTMTGSNVQASSTSQPCKFVRVENEAGNAIVKYGTSLLSATVYAGSVLADTATINNGVIIGPFSGEAPMDLTNLYFLGTDGQEIHLTVVTH